MNKKNNSRQNLAQVGSETGSVLMEYVLVQVLVASLLFAVMDELFYGWWLDEMFYGRSTGTFGPAGVAVKYFYQRLLGGLSLPIP